MLQEMRQLDFRPSPEPAMLAPVTVRSVGHYRLVRNPVKNPPRGFTQLFWIQSGAIRYKRRGKWYRAGRREGFFFGSGEAHLVEPQGTGADYYWITCDGPDVGTWLQKSGIGPAPMSLGDCPVESFEELRLMINRASTAAELEASLLGTRILAAFANGSDRQPARGTSGPETLCRKLEAMLEEHLGDPEFGIENAATLLGIHRSTLFRIYRKRRGLTPSEYLQRIRLKKGLELLKEGILNVTEVAQACGFRDSGYFTKVVRKATGETPLHIRRQN